jgi:signal transduction histidine kinase
VSHELRTPIASVRMLAELLEEDRVEVGEVREVHEALAREARRLGETVDRLLGFSRLAAGKLVMARERGDVAAPVRAAIAAFRERHPGAELTEDLAADATCEIDAGQIEVVVTNLLENALKYAPKGQPYRVALRASSSRAEGAPRGGGAVVSVRDAGPGIARKHHRRIFEPFERVDDRLNAATEGSGIGLSLVRQIARAHGGDAWVESAPGEGATFFVRIGASSSSGRGG